MAITKDTTSSAVGGSATSLTWAHTVGTGSNTILVVAVRISSGTATVTGVTYNAVSMTQLTSKVQGSNTVYLFYILLGSTTSASHNIVASFSATVTSIGTATSYFNVAQSGTWGTAATSSGASGNSSNTVTTTASSQEVVDINYELGTTDATSGASQTKEVSNGTSALGWLDFGDIAATGSSMSLSWTNPTNTAWIELSAAMNVAGTQATKSLGVRLRLAAQKIVSAGVRLRLATKNTQSLGLRLHLTTGIQSGGFALFANGTGVASFDDFRVTSYPDPALALEPVGRLGSSFVSWNSILPSPATTLGMYTSLRGHGSDWVDISAQNGGSISGLYPQPDPTIDGFGVDSHLLYDSSFQGYQGYDNPIRPNQSGWGTASDGQPWTELTASGVTFAVSSNELTATGSVNAFVQALGSSTLSDCDVAARLASTSASDVLAVAFRITASNTYYFVRIGGGTLEIRKSVAGVITSLVSQVFTTTANTFYRVRGRVIGTTLQCKAFADGANDPGWMLSVTDSAIAGPGQFGLRHALNAAGNTASSDQFLAAFVISGEAPPGPAISTWDTAKSRLVLQGGTNALVLQRGVSRAYIDVLTTLDRADAGGRVFRMVDYSNFYALVIADASSSVGTPNRVTLYKYVAGAATHLAQATIAFT